MKISYDYADYKKRLRRLKYKKVLIGVIIFQKSV